MSVALPTLPARRQRGDFGRATAQILDDVLPALPLGMESLCDLAIAACGAAGAAVYSRSGDGAPHCLATRPSLMPPPDASLLQRTRPQTVAGAASILVGAWAAHTDSPTHLLAIYTHDQRGFTATDRRRLRVICALMRLGQRTQSLAQTGSLLQRAAALLREEPNTDRRLQRMAELLAEAAQSDHCLIWLRPSTSGGELRLRAAFGAQGEESSADLPTLAPQIQQRVQRELAAFIPLEQPTAVAASALPWLSEVLGIAGESLSENAVVMPIRHAQGVVGMAVCTTTTGSAVNAVEKLDADRQTLLLALADQIALTAIYARTALTAQASARRYALLAAIGEISLARMGMDEMLDSILARVHGHFDSSATSLFLLSSEGGALRTRSLRTSKESSGGRDARVPLSHEGATLGTLSIRPSEALTDDDYETLAQVADQIALALATSGRYQIQAAMAVLDGLTGLPNRRSADSTLEKIVTQAHSSGMSAHIILMDLDHFKQVNDTHGHATGDAVLQAAGQMLRAQLRATDSMARFGGEEFLLMLPDVDHSIARRVCERVRHAVTLLNVRLPDSTTLPLTASFGGTTVQAGDTSASVLQRADDALYRAKGGGRNRVKWSDE